MASAGVHSSHNHNVWLQLHMRVNAFPGTRSWWEPLSTSTEKINRSDPLANQVTHFAAVIRGEAQPICSGRDGLKSLKVVAAFTESARTGHPVQITN